jgi:hypothetical protein
VWKFLDRHGRTLEKIPHASEQERPDVRAARHRWADRQSDIAPERLIFIDESGLSTKMARLLGWAVKGERCRANPARSLEDHHLRRRSDARRAATDR